MVIHIKKAWNFTYCGLCIWNNPKNTVRKKDYKKATCKRCIKIHKIVALKKKVCFLCGK